MPEAWSEKREREYEVLKEKFEEEGRYPGREKEVAARIVNKQRAQHSETIDQRERDAEGTSPDADLPIERYDNKTAEQIGDQLDDLDPRQLKQVKAYEEEHRQRKTVLEEVERKLD